MVQKILSGKKSQTRRIVKFPKHIEQQDNGLYTLFADGDCYENQHMEQIKGYIDCPYKVGMVLWVRETTYLFGKWVRNGVTKTGKQKYKFVWDKAKPVIYAADGEPDYICRDNNEVGYFKRPSIFMPLAVCRLKLQITNVGVERLQEITEDDAIKEGFSPLIWSHTGEVGMKAKTNFSLAWNDINGKRGYGWEVNPYIWKITFERVSEDAI
jgi:hypothetical protein